MSIDLRKNLFGEPRSLREKIADFLVGSQEVRVRQGKDKMEVIERPDVISRIRGDKDKYYLAKGEDDPNEMATKMDPFTSKSDKVIPPTTEILQPKKESIFKRAKDKIVDVFDGDNQEANVIQAQPEIVGPAELPTEPEKTQSNIFPQSDYKNLNKDSIQFRFSTPEMKQGDERGLPVISGKPFLEFVKDFNPPLPTSPKKIIIKNKQTGKVIDEVTGVSQLETARKIMAASDVFAPEWTNYLLRLGYREGKLKADARRDKKDNPGGGNDRGVLQLNDLHHPAVPDDVAYDPIKATVWAIGLMNSGTPIKGDNKLTGQEQWMSDEWVKQHDLEIVY